MPLTLEGRLLCASTHAYAIRAGGPVPDTFPPPAPPRSALVGYTAPPVGFVSGQDLIDAGLVGSVAEGVVVAFRGTLPPSNPDKGRMILDWASDAEAPLLPGTKLPGLVHQGFRDALDALWPGMEPVIDAAMAAAPGRPVYVTGHSKGGAVAHLAAMRILNTWAGVQVIVRTFAAARAGNDEFVARYVGSGIDSLRYEYADDIVPHLPPKAELLTMLRAIPLVGAAFAHATLGYESAGALAYLPRGGGAALPDSPALQAKRRQDLVARVVSLDFDTIAHDHGLDINGGYAQAICPGV